uniref:Protein neuralized n=1 Tax=Aceria tosichella TaxID=561515 RepID=A0A6G1SFP2_9ACAR
MGMIKRVFQRTSRKLLAKIVPPAHSHQLVLNPPLQTNDCASSLDQRSMRKLASLQRKFKKSGNDTAMAEALLLAVKNHLPPVQFHHIHGPNVQLTKNKCVARRTQSFCQALVFSNRVILPNERVYIKVLEIAKGWSGTIRFGFTAVDPATLACRMPKHACPDMTNAGHTWARALADEVVRRNSVIHFSYNKNGLIHYGINNQDCGVFHANVGTNQNLWFIVDIYGLTAAIELIDPRVNNASSELDISQLDDSHNSSLNRSTMFKSTSAMEEIFGRYGANETRSRKKQSRKQAARHAAMIQNNWAFENSIGTQFLGFGLPHNQQYPTGTQLPNLNSINLPSAQQNIYSPMPNVGQEASMRAPTDLHDYHQIYNKACPSNLQSHVSTSRLVAANGSTASVSLIPQTTSTSSSFLACRPVNNSSSTNRSELEISQMLDSIHLQHDKRPKQQQQHSTPKNSRSLTSAQMPVASTRKRLQQQQPSSSQTNLKRTLDASDKVVANRSIGSKSQSSSLAQSASKSTTSSGASHASEKSSKTRHSIKNQKSAATSSSDRDKNNNSPQSKDCPICFERPINCVLYQCGHMCTCYECGVKQWKTQSRTCPICRTIIKDVIKTYMS